VFTHGFSCVHGPPGASKSTFIIEVVRWMMFNTQCDIVVCSAKQEQVEDITRKLVNRVESIDMPDQLVRIHSPSRSQSMMYLLGEKDVENTNESSGGRPQRHPPTQNDGVSNYDLHNLAQQAARDRHQLPGNQGAMLGSRGNYLNDIEQHRQCNWTRG
jgi:hypothetical protein